MERRIEDALQVHRVISVTSDLPPPDQALSRATEAASAAFITVRIIDRQTSSRKLTFFKSSGTEHTRTQLE